MCRPLDKNPNWKGGITTNKVELNCNFCNKVFTSKPYTSNKFCSLHCNNASQKFTKIIKQRRKLLIISLIDTIVPYRYKACNLKKQFCSICGINEVKRKVIFCNGCRPKKKQLNINCKFCGKSVVKYVGEGTIYCNNKCMFDDYKGKNNPHYIDGRTPQNQKIRASHEYKIWRKLVFKRDKYTCVWCGQIGGELHADHIKQFAFYPELRLDLNNGRTLCKPCHMKTDSYLKGRPKVKRIKRQLTLF